MTKAKIELPPKLVPLFEGKARYRCAHGGRGSGKTFNFAKMTAIRGYAYAEAGISGQILCGREFQNSLEESSFYEIKSAINSVPWLREYYDVGEKYIRTKCGRIKYTFTGLRSNLDSVKSKGKILIAWVDEAETVSELAWEKLAPTVREDDSEIWVTWNPESDESATHERFRKDPPTNSKVVELNWRDNPWFNKVMQQERLDALEKRPDTYDWIWEGKFHNNQQGSIYASFLLEAKDQNRITFAPYKDGVPVITAWDLGKNDCTSIWFAQVVGFQVRIIDFYENSQEDLAHYAKLIRSKPYEYGKHYLPHDGRHERLGMNGSIKDQLSEMGLKCDTLPVATRKAGIALARELLKTCFFDEDKCKDGLKCLRNYKFEYDEKRKTFSNEPRHDWTSHAADAFRYLAAALKVWEPETAEEEDYTPHFNSSGSWMN